MAARAPRRLGLSRRHTARIRAAWRDRAGQTVTEYLMIAGLLSAMIIMLTQIIVPGVANPVVDLVRHMVVYLSSV